MNSKYISVLLFFLIVTLRIGYMELNRRNEMKITSKAFQNECMIPEKYTCKGQDISPSLKWEGAPAGTKGFVIICDDLHLPFGKIRLRTKGSDGVSGWGSVRIGTYSSGPPLSKLSFRS